MLLSRGFETLLGETGLGTFFAPLSGRASGGPVTAGRPYLVGEREHP
jgi:hypothetical protein